MMNNEEDTDGSAYDEWDEVTIPDTTTDAQMFLFDENNLEMEDEEDDATSWNDNSEEDTDYDTEEDEETEEETEEEVNTNDEMNDDFSDTESETSWSDGDGEPWQYSIQIDRYEERNDRGWE